MEFHLKIIGTMMIVLALVHSVFPKTFRLENRTSPAQFDKPASDVCAYFFHRRNCFSDGNFMFDLDSGNRRNKFGAKNSFGTWILLVSQIDNSIFRLFLRTLER